MQLFERILEIPILWSKGRASGEVLLQLHFNSSSFYVPKKSIDHMFQFRALMIYYIDLFTYIAFLNLRDALASLGDAHAYVLYTWAYATLLINIYISV